MDRRAQALAAGDLLGRRAERQPDDVLAGDGEAERRDEDGEQRGRAGLLGERAVREPLHGDADDDADHDPEDDREDVRHAGAGRRPEDAVGSEYAYVKPNAK